MNANNTNKIVEILKTKKGYYYDSGDSVVFIFVDPTLVYDLLGGLFGYRLEAISVDKKTGTETEYDLCKPDTIGQYDFEKLKHFISFGPGEHGTSLLEDLHGPRKAS